MVTTLFAMMVLAPAGSVHCPVMGGAVNEMANPAVVYGGVRYPMCCGGCDGAFAKDPAKYAKATKEGESTGVFMFDAVSGQKVNFGEKGVKFGPVDYKGVRYYFTSEANKKSFASNSAKYASSPAKESLYCPIGKEDIANASEAGGYVDYKGVRYYVCCPDCLGALKGSVAKVAAGQSSHVKAIAAVRLGS